jgi:putative DNA primase/helicase
VGRTVSTVEKKTGAATAAPLRLPAVARGDQLPPAQPVRWLWPGRIPSAGLTLLAGAPGGGKTSAAASLLASLTAGRPWPDNTPAGAPGPVLIIAHEDDPGSLAARWAAAGVDLSRLRLWLRTKENKRPRFPRDLEELGGLLRTLHPLAVVVDPLAAYVRTTGPSDAIRDQLAGFLDLCAEHGAAVIALAHPSKASATAGRSGLYFAAGSAALPELARSAAVLAQHPDDERRRVLAWAKLSAGPLPGSLAFEIAPSADGHPAAIGWRAEALTAAELLERTGEERDQMAEARRWLRALLAGGRSVRAADALKLAARDGISRRTLERARAAEGVQSLRRGTGWAWIIRDGKPARRK